MLIIYAYANSPELATGADDSPSTAMGSSVRSCPANCATRSRSSGVSVRSLAYACMQKCNMKTCSLIVLWRILTTHWQCFGTSLSLIDNALAQACHSLTMFWHKPVTHWQCFGASLSLIDNALAQACHALTIFWHKPATHWQCFGRSLSLIDNALAQACHSLTMLWRKPFTHW